jgi:predicted ATP-binding protein involved in virulence
MEQEVDFKMEKGKTILNICQALSDEEFIDRVSNIGKQIYNMEESIRENSKEVLRIGEQSENTKKMIVQAGKDYDKAVNFLKKNHKENLISKVESEVTKFKEEMKKAKEEQEKMKTGGN